MTMLRSRNRRTLAAVSANAENTENTLQPRRQGCISAGLFALVFLGMTSSAASAGEYCITDSSHMRNCGYDTMAQCLASASGRNGDCARDPFWVNPTNAYAYQPKRHHSKARKPTEN